MSRLCVRACLFVCFLLKHNPYFEMDGRELACLNAPFKLKDMKSDFLLKRCLYLKKIKIKLHF